MKLPGEKNHSGQNYDNLEIPKYRIHFLGLCYLVAMIAWSATNTLIYSLYVQANLETLVLLNGIGQYIGFGFSSPIVVHIIRSSNLKKAIFLGFVGIGIQQIVIVFTVAVAGKDLFILSSLGFLWTINLVTTIFAGISNSIIWICVPLYVQSYCQQIEEITKKLTSQQQSEKKQMTAMMGTFYSVQMWSSIIGGILNIFSFGYANFSLYTFIIIGIACLSLIMCWLLLHPYKLSNNRQKSNSQNQQMEQLLNNEGERVYDSSLNTSQALLKQLKHLWKILKKMPNILIYNYLIGLILSFYLVFINKLVKKSVPHDISEAQLNTKIAIVFLFQGSGSVLVGLAQSKLPFYYKANKRQNLYYQFILIQIALIFTLLGFNLLQNTGNYYWTCFVIVIFWSIAEIHVKSAVDAYIKKYLEGKVQYYSLGIFIYSFGSITLFLIFLIPSDNIELLIVIIIFLASSIIWMVREQTDQEWEKAQQKSDTKDRIKDIQLRVIN